MANEISVDPELIQQVYKQKLSEATEQVILLTAAATQFQNQVAELTREVETLKAQMTRDAEGSPEPSDS